LDLHWVSLLNVQPHYDALVNVEPLHREGRHYVMGKLGATKMIGICKTLCS